MYINYNWAASDFISPPPAFDFLPRNASRRVIKSLIFFPSKLKNNIFQVWIMSNCGEILNFIHACVELVKFLTSMTMNIWRLQDVSDYASFNRVSALFHHQMIVRHHQIAMMFGYQHHQTRSIFAFPFSSLLPQKFRWCQGQIKGVAWIEGCRSR